MATSRIEIIVTDRGGARRVARDVRSIGPAADRAAAKARTLTQTLRSTATVTRDLRNLFIILGAARIVKGLVTATDEFKQMKNTLRGFDVGAKNINAVRKQIVGVANASRTGARATATLFGRLKKATKDLGLSNAEVLQLTGTAQKALRLGGASSVEATQAVRQLSQAFNKGKLDGDEFRSVLENAPILAELLSEKLGVTKTVLRKMAEEGKITTEILVGALQDGADRIEERFNTLEQTFGDVFTKIRNNIIAYIGEIDEARGISASFISVLDDFARNTGPNVEAIFGAMAVSSLAFVGILSRMALKLAPLAIAFAIFKTIDSEIRSSTDGARGLKDIFIDMKFGVDFLIDAVITLINKLGILFSLDPKDGGPIEQLINGIALESVVSEGIIADMVDKMLGGDSTSKAVTAQAFLNASRSKFVKDLQKEQTGGFRIVPGDGDLVKKVPLTKLDPDITSRGLKKLFDEKKFPFFKSPEAETGFGAIPIGTLGGLISRQITPEGKQLKAIIDRQTEILKAQFKTDIIEGMKTKSNPRGSVTAAGQNARFTEEQNKRTMIKTANELEAIMGNITEILDSAAGKQNALADQAANTANQILAATEKFAPEEKLRKTKELITSLAPVLSDLEKISGQEAILKSELDLTARALEEKLNVLSKKTEKLQGEEKTKALALMDEITRKAAVIMKAASAETASAIAAAYEGILSRLEAAAARAGVSVPAAAAAGAGVGFGGGIVDPFTNAGPGLSTTGAGTPGAPYEETVDGIQSSIDALREFRTELNSVDIDQARTFGNMSRNTQNFGQQLGSFANDLQTTFTNVFSSLEDALVSFVTTGKFDFKKLVNAMLADLARLLIRMLIIRPLMGFFGGLFGFGGGGLVPGFSGGGFASVGSLGGGGGFAISSGGCANGACNIPGFARGSGVIAGFGGSRSDNQLARLSPGEFVMNAQDTRRNLPDLHRMNNGQSPTGRSTSGNVVVNNISTTVNVQGGSGGNQEQDAARGRKIVQAVDQQIEKRLTEFARRESRPGGMLQRSSQ